MSFPEGAILTTTTAKTGSGWIVGANCAHCHNINASNKTGYRRVTLLIDGGGAVYILYITSSETSARHGQSAGCGGISAIRYESGFTPASATSNEATGSFGILYIPD